MKWNNINIPYNVKTFYTDVKCYRFVLSMLRDKGHFTIMEFKTLSLKLEGRPKLKKDNRLYHWNKLTNFRKRRRFNWN